MLLGYARVSTDDQNLYLQRDARLKAGCERLFEDTASGGINYGVRFSMARSKLATPGLSRPEELLRSPDIFQRHYQYRCHDSPLRFNAPVRGRDSVAGDLLLIFGSKDRATTINRAQNQFQCLLSFLTPQAWQAFAKKHYFGL